MRSIGGDSFASADLNVLLSADLNVLNIIVYLMTADYMESCSELLNSAQPLSLLNVHLVLSGHRAAARCWLIITSGVN